jgi:hypothetical protein
LKIPNTHTKDWWCGSNDRTPAWWVQTLVLPKKKKKKINAFCSGKRILQEIGEEAMAEVHGRGGGGHDAGRRLTDFL